jgi:hypothetical protein
MSTCYCIRKKKYAPFVNAKGEVIDNGEPIKIKLWENDNEKLVKIFLDNLKGGGRVKEFKFWIE